MNEKIRRCKMAQQSLDKVAGLPQTTAVWHATVRRAPAWITPKNKPPYRPFLTLVLDAAADRIRGSNMQDDRPGPELVLKTLTDAMLHPIVGGGKRSRPGRILIDDTELVQALQPRLAEIGVRCEYHAGSAPITNALREMDAHMSRRPMRQGLLSVPGATLPLVTEFFAAAADFYEEAPWRWLDNMAPIEFHYPTDGPARYLVVLGNGGEEFGLSLYQSLDDLRAQYLTQDPEQLFRKITALSITFDEPMALAFEDLDAIEAHGWPIVGSRAYPLVMKVVPPMKMVAPNAGEVALLAATLRAVPDFVTGNLHADRGVPAAAEATFPLPNVHAGQGIRLRYPVDLPEIWGTQGSKVDEKELEVMIEHWYQDDPSHQFARQVGAFLLQFLNYLETTGRSEEVLRRHEGNVWWIGKLTCKYGGYETFSPSIFLGGPLYLKEYEEQASSSKGALTSYKTTWRRLEDYVRMMGY
jgi:hypothetical protein